MNITFLPETNWVDIIVIIFLIRGGYIGLAQGFSVELFKIFATVASCVLSLLYYGILSQWISSHSFLSLQVADFLSILILLAILLFIFRVIRVFLFRLLHLQLILELERWGGFILGVVRGTIFVSLFLFMLTLLPLEYVKESIEEKSFSGPYIQKVAPEILHFIMMFKPKSEEMK